MLYNLYHFTGKYVICGPDKAMNLFSTGKWYDQTNYKNDEEKSHALRTLQLHKDEQRKKSEHQRCEQSSKQDVHGDGTRNSSGKIGNETRCEKQRKNEGENEGNEVLKKKRGRPPKRK